jgi:hypothetical protein
MKRIPSSPPSIARLAICTSEGLKPHKNNAGMVKMTPEAKDELAEPMVWDMLFSRMVVPLPKRTLEKRKKATVITATGMEVETVRPAFRPRYAFAAPNNIPKMTPETPE